MIKEVAATILEEKGVGVQGKSIYIYRAPDNVRGCILIMDTIDPTALDENLPGYLKSTFKVIARNPDYKSALTIANEVIKALDSHRVTVNGIYVHRMRATHKPIAYPVPDSDMKEVSVHMWAAYSEP